jgi:hypothetical protein
MRESRHTGTRTPRRRRRTPLGRYGFDPAPSERGIQHARQSKPRQCKLPIHHQPLPVVIGLVDIHSSGEFPSNRVVGSGLAEGTRSEHKMSIFRAREAKVDSWALSVFAHFYCLDGQFRLFVRGFLP